MTETHPSSGRRTGTRDAGEVPATASPPGSPRSGRFWWPLYVECQPPVPLHRVGVRLGNVDRHPRRREVVGQRRVPDLLDPHPDLGGRRLGRAERVAEDLEHAQLAGPVLLRVVLGTSRTSSDPERWQLALLASREDHIGR